MEHGRSLFARPAHQRVVGLGIGAGQFLVIVERGERLGGHQPAGQLDSGQQYPSIGFMRQIIGLNFRMGERIGRTDPDIAQALRPLLPGAAGHAGKAVEHSGDAAGLVTGGGEGELQIRRIQRLVGLPEDMDQRRADRENARAADRPFRDFRPQARRAGIIVDRQALGPRHHAHGIVIAQILADAGELMHRLDPKAG